MGGHLKKELLLLQLRRLGNNKYCEKNNLPQGPPKKKANKHKLRDDNEMTALEDIEWFIDHTCNLNHTGIPQV